MRWGVVCLFAALAAPITACGDDGPDPDACPIDGDPSIEVGVPDSITFLDFAPLVDGGDIPLSSNGQTFLAVQMALRATNLGKEAFIEMSVSYQPATGPAQVAVKDASQSERLFCRDDNRLYVIPVVVSSEDLGNDTAIQDQTVDVSITVTDLEDRTASGQASGILRRL